MRRGQIRFASWVVGVVVLCSGSAARAELRLPAVFSDHAVLQAGMDVPVWGWAEPEQQLTVQLGTTKATAKADATGRWLVKLPAMKASETAAKLVVTSGSERLEREDILIGEVWVGSGQSNMAMSVGGSEKKDEFIREANRPTIRLFTAPRRPKDEPADDVEGKWVLCSPETVKTSSAALYHLGRNLQEQLHVPVGLIHSSWGGTPIQVWMPADAFGSAEDLAAERAKFRARLRLTSQPTTTRKAASPNPTQRLQPGTLYNGMIAPLVPYAIRGVAWYQGENNVHFGEAGTYAQRMAAMVKSWRQHWGQGDWTFLYVQIAPYGKYPETGPSLPEMWEQQVAALKLIPKSGMAPIQDLGNATNIHPTNKHEVGRRLAMIALAETYGKTDVVHQGPMYASHKIEGGKVRVRFSGAAGGLVSRDGEELDSFEVAGEDGKFVPAKATIEGDEVVLSAEGIEKPVAVRFAWTATAMPNLANKEGWPAVAFRTKAEN